MPKMIHYLYKTAWQLPLNSAGAKKKYRVALLTNAQWGKYVKLCYDA